MRLIRKVRDVKMHRTKKETIIEIAIKVKKKTQKRKEKERNKGSIKK